MIEKESCDKSHSKEIECGDLRVIFDWRRDRFGHRVEARTGGDWCAILESAEGSPDTEWPPSPALQSLHFEDREPGRVALLVGQAAKSHWSASVEPLQDKAGFQFDVACRTQHAPAHLGSAYRAVVSSDEPIIEIVAHDQLVACEKLVTAETIQWRIHPRGVSSEYPATIRWQYTIALRLNRRPSNPW